MCALIYQHYVSMRQQKSPEICSKMPGVSIVIKTSLLHMWYLCQLILAQFACHLAWLVEQVNKLVITLHSVHVCWLWCSLHKHKVYVCTGRVLADSEGNIVPNWFLLGFSTRDRASARPRLIYQGERDKFDLHLFDFLALLTWTLKRCDCVIVLTQTKKQSKTYKAHKLKKKTWNKDAEVQQMYWELWHRFLASRHKQKSTTKFIFFARPWVESMKHIAFRGWMFPLLLTHTVLCNWTTFNQTLDCWFDHTGFFPALLWSCTFRTASDPLFKPLYFHTWGFASLKLR